MLTFADACPTSEQGAEALHLQAGNSKQDCLKLSSSFSFLYFSAISDIYKYVTEANPGIKPREEMIAQLDLL